MQLPDPKDYSILAFIIENGLQNEKGEPISFDERPFLLDIFDDWTPDQVYKKCAQVGVSITMIIKTTFAALRWGWNIIYTLPTDDDVREFVKSKTNKIYSANKPFQSLNTDNIEMKEIGDRFIYYKGTISKTAAIMTTADLLVHDEEDRSSPSTLSTFKSRTKASKFKGRWGLSNPSMEKTGVDLRWLKSDMKEWVITCNKCETPQYLTWPDSIDVKRKVRVCKHCGKELTRQELLYGKWYATYGKTDPSEWVLWNVSNPTRKISGWHISQLMCVWVAAEELIEESEGDQEYFYNFVLGEPYNPADFKIGRSMILDNWTPKVLETNQYYLGVDVGNLKHYVLGSEKGVFKVGKFSEWSELDKILKLYKPTMVIDAMPDNTMSRHYVENYDKAYMSYFKLDKERKKLIWFGQKEEQGVVYSDRNRIIDYLINHILNGQMLFGVPSDMMFREYVKHWETLRRIKETSNLGIERYVWDSTTGVDHFVFATIYYLLALQTGGQGKYIPEPVKEERMKLVEQTAAGPVIGDLKRIFEEDQQWER